MATKRAKKQAKIQLGKNVFITAANETALIKHITDRMNMSDAVRKIELQKYTHIDRELNGWLKRDAEDQKRAIDNRKGHGIKPTDAKLPLTWAQLDEAVTYLVTVLAPDEAMYTAQGPVDKQDVAKGFSVLMNKHAEQFGHFRHYAKFVFNCLRYNIGLFDVEWCEIVGNTIGNSQAAQQPEVTRGIVSTGNKITALDMYNTLYDVTVDPVDLTRQGEWYAKVAMRAPFRWRKMQADGEIFGVERFIDKIGQRHYFENKPEIRCDAATGISQTDWHSILSAGEVTGEVGRGLEECVYTGWIIPAEFGLSSSKVYELWRFMTADKSHAVSATHLSNAHGLLPINVAMPIDDEFLWASVSYAERLMPYQSFASFQMNVHQRASRKRLYGLTVYDKKTIPLLDSDDTDLAGGKIPASNMAEDVDLRKKIVQFTDGPDTSRTMDDVERMDGLMQKVMPTDILKQVAGLERATQYQAAATVQGGNRRNLKIAKTINSQAMDSGRHMQMFNILQFQAQMEILGPEGKTIQINPAELRGAGLEFAIADGLKGLDRLSLIIHMKEVLNAVLQSQQAAAQFDVVGIINHWTSLLGDHTDFKQFKITSPIDQLPPDQKDMAYQLLQQAMQQQQQGGEGGGAPQ